MRREFIVTTLAALLLPAWSLDKNISGTYVAADDGGAMMVQLVETPNGQLDGQFQGVTIGPDGQLISRSSVVHGTTNDGKISLVSAGNSAISLFGSMNKSHLLLNGAAQFGQMDLQQSEPARYQQAYLAIQSRSQQILADAARAKIEAETAAGAQKFIVEIKSLIGELTTFNAGQTVRLQKIAATENEFSPITAKMASFLEQERGLPGEANFLARTRLYLTVNKGRLTASGRYTNFQNGASDLRRRLARFATRLEEGNKVCNAVGNTPATLPTELKFAVDTSCGQLREMGPAFTDNAAAASAALDAVEAAYAVEQTKQEQMVEEANHLE